LRATRLRARRRPRRFERCSHAGFRCGEASPTRKSPSRVPLLGSPARQPEVSLSGKSFCLGGRERSGRTMRTGRLLTFLTATVALGSAQALEAGARACPNSHCRRPRSRWHGPIPRGPFTLPGVATTAQPQSLLERLPRLPRGGDVEAPRAIPKSTSKCGCRSRIGTASFTRSEMPVGLGRSPLRR
jgi:hypothetical protein